MTFFRQLLVAILVLVLALLAGALAINFNSTRSFLEAQLQSHAQDTATHLGMALSEPAQQDDRVAMNAIVDALFDRGYYRTIVVRDVSGKPWVSRSEPVRIKSVPDWFIKHVALQAPTASALVMGGWAQKGEVSVSSHPGYAYLELWRTFRGMTLWFALAAVVAVAAGGLILRVLLKPLRQIEGQAVAISEHRYEIQEKLPRTRELRRVVRAMNQMVARVRAMFEEQASTAGHLQELAFRDPLTGMGNRRYFEQQFAACLEEGSEQHSGLLMLAQLNGLQALNDTAGFSAGDDLLKAAAAEIESEFPDRNCAVSARLGGADFVILLPGLDAGSGRRAAEVLVTRLQELHRQELAPHAEVCNIGLAGWARGAELTRVLAEADLALRAAQAQGENSVYQHRGDVVVAPEISGRSQWQSYLAGVLERGEVSLLQQPAVASANHDHVMHRELLARLPAANGDLISAGVFMPMAEQFGMSAELDLSVLRLALESGINEEVAVNISINSLRSPVFVDSLLGLLAAADGQPRVTFEISEYQAVDPGPALADFVARVRKLGHGFALDHFGREFSTFAHMHALRPDYVKIDRTLLVNIVQDHDTRFLVRTLCSVAHSLDVLAIAEAVEDEARLEVIQSLGVDGIQGYFIARPQPM